MDKQSQLASVLATQFTTEAGTMIRTRLIRPEDADHLIDLFNHLSPATKRRRFNAGLQNIDETRVRATAEQLASVDNRTDGGAILGFADMPEGERLIGVARFARLPDSSEKSVAEVAVVVRDDFQRQGIGTELLRLLLILARQIGIDVLTAGVQADNTTIFHMLSKMEIPVRSSTHQGETELWIDVDRASV